MSLGALALRTLLQNSTAQLTMLFAFARASELFQQKKKKGTVYVDPTYTFLILRVYAASEGKEVF